MLHGCCRRKVAVVPPDFTRYHSRAGEITSLIYRHYGDAVADIMPALGTHAPVSDEQREKMFGGVPANLFRVHNWRDDVITIGEVPAALVHILIVYHCVRINFL
jgi:nickel-dependent lactate racemase